MAAPRFSSAYLQKAAKVPGIRLQKERAYSLLGISPGDVVVDVGCGPAIDTIQLAGRVGPNGMVTGFDADPVLVDEANRHATLAGVGGCSRHIVADAAHLPVDAGSADACFSERLLQHVPWHACAGVVAEMMRVLKPGGRLVIVDTDWATLSIGAPDPLLERQVVQEHLLGFANPFCGRYLSSLLRGAGVDELSVETSSFSMDFDALEFLLAPTLARGVASGRLAAFDAQRFSSGLRGVRDYGVFFAHLSMVTASGRKSAATHERP